MSSEILDQPIDPDGSTPLFDNRTNTFFKTERGQLAFQFLLNYAIAKLVFKARAVSISFVIPFAKAALAGLTCRWSSLIFDPRIPGGQAFGKVVSYKLLASPSGGMRAAVTIGCCIGRGGEPEVPVEGVGTYAAPGYMADGYQVMKGKTISIPSGELTYQSFDDFIINDTSINLFDMTPENVVKSVTIIADKTIQGEVIAGAQNAHDQQFSVFGNSTDVAVPDPTTILKNAYTKILLKMHSIDGSGLETNYAITVSKLKLPKTIDLEAPSA
jgi:hypothetical protein